MFSIELSEFVYKELENYNLPDSGNGFSAETYSNNPVERLAFTAFEKAYKNAVSKGKSNKRYIINIETEAIAEVAVNCLENVEHFYSNAACNPNPAVSGAANRAATKIMEFFKLKKWKP